MKKDELIKKLSKLGIQKNEYSLNDGLKSNSYIIEENHGMWFVFFYERGDRIGEKLFIEESKAYEYLYNIFVKENQTK